MARGQRGRRGSGGTPCCTLNFFRGVAMVRGIRLKMQMFSIGFWSEPIYRTGVSDFLMHPEGATISLTRVGLAGYRQGNPSW